LVYAGVVEQMDEKPIFIADQRLYVLKLPADRRVSVKQALQLKRLPEYDAVDQSHHEWDRDKNEPRDWRPIDAAGQRAAFLQRLGGGEENSTNSIDRRLVCITSSAGIGKSIALSQAAYLRSQLEDHIVIEFHLEAFPNSPGAFWGDEAREGGSKSVVEQIHSVLSRDESEGFPALPDSYREGIKEWLTQKIQDGKVTLFVDGLDEVSREEATAKAGALRRLLRDHAHLHCMVAGRPYAVVDALWNPLFSVTQQSGRDDSKSNWTFCCVGMFHQGQIKKAIGPERFAKLMELAGTFTLTPRTIEVLRGLPIARFNEVQTLADVYWESFLGVFDQDVRRKNKGISLQATGLPFDQYLEYASALAWTMFRYGSSKAEYRAISDELLKNLRGQDRWRNETVDALDSKKGTIAAANAGMIEFRLFDSFNEKVEWRSATLRDFFAALWLVRYSTVDDRSFVKSRIPKVFAVDPERSIHPDSQELWTFICGMSKKVVDSKQQNWLEMIDAVYQPCYPRPRPTEMMSIAWPRLERIAQSANGAAKEHAAGIIGRFLGEFKALQSIPETKSIIDRDLVFSREIPEPGESLKVRVGHDDQLGNSEQDVELQERYLALAYPCTRAIFRLFDPGHEHLYGEELDWYAQDPRCPVIGVTWWDAEMFARWSGSRLLTELEWEYACRAESKDSSGDLSKYYWPDDGGGEQIHRYAWVSENSEGVSHPVGGKIANRYGLFDMLGNVDEWTESRILGGDGSRVCRGGSFSLTGRVATASARISVYPSLRQVNIGFRVARSSKGKS
jgi:hypothetical protein